MALPNFVKGICNLNIVVAVIKWLKEIRGSPPKISGRMGTLLPQEWDFPKNSKENCLAITKIALTECKQKLFDITFSTTLFGQFLRLAKCMAYTKTCTG